MRKFLSLLLLLLVFNCSPKINYIDGHKIIRYGTKEFENFEKHATINKEEAWAIQKEVTNKEQVRVTYWLFFIIDKDYIFTAPINPEKMETELTGLSVNSETGAVKDLKSGIDIKYENVYNGDNKNFPYKIKRKYKKK